MATRIIPRRATGIGTAWTQVGDVIQPPTGVKWTIVEFRVSLSAPGDWLFKLDEVEMWGGRYELDFGLKGKPHIVALDLVYPLKLILFAKADSGTIDCTAEITIEETTV